MALPFLPVLKALPAIITSAGGIIASVNARRAPQAAIKVEERIKRLEDDVVSTGKVLTGLAEQVQAIAQELRVQAERDARRERRVGVLSGVSILAVVVAIGCLVVAGFR